jgi:hypothetical protein
VRGNRLTIKDKAEYMSHGQMWGSGPCIRLFSALFELLYQISLVWPELKSYKKYSIDIET